MISTAFYERRKGSGAIDFNDRRSAERRAQEKAISPEQRRLASQIRRYEREAFKIPVRLKIQNKEVSGYTHDISPEGLLVFSDTSLSPGTPMTLQFAFGENVCSLNVSGQVLFCRTVKKNGSAPQAIGIKFSGIRDFEQKILTSAVEELRQNSATQEKSLLNILVSADTLGQEAADFYNRSPQTFDKKVSTKNYTELNSSIGKVRRKYCRVILNDTEIAEIEVSYKEADGIVKTIAARVTDISPAGVSFSTQVVLMPIPKINIELKLPEPYGIAKCRAKLCWRDDRLLRYGVQFVFNNNIDRLIEVEKFLDVISLKTLKDRRQYPTRRCNSVVKGTVIKPEEQRRTDRRICDLWKWSLEKSDSGGAKDIKRLKAFQRAKGLGYSNEAVQIQREWLSEHVRTPLKHIGVFSEDPQAMQGNIEGLIGVAQVPLGIAGPLKINGDHAQGIFYMPMATTEGAIVYTYTLGMQLVSLAGGVNVYVLRDEINISPIFVFENTNRAQKFVRWLEGNFGRIKEEAEKTTKHGKLIRLEPNILDRNIVVKFCYATGDAMGLNMINIATEQACRFIVSTVRPEEFYLRSNFSSVKKVSAHNFATAGFGKMIIADVVVPRELLKRVFNVTPEAMARYCHLAFVSSAHAGMVGMNGHTANGLAAIFIACGQDVANVVDSQVSMSACETTKNGDLYVSLKIPNLVVGTVGGGMNLGTQRECLSILGCYGMGKAKKFSEIVAASLLAGEIGVAAAIVNGSFVDAHKKYGRKSSDILQGRQQ